MSIQSTKRSSTFAFEIKAGAFTIKTDVPEKLGGEDTAPDPHQYLEAALAGCTAITVQMYAKRKNIPLDYSDVSIKITSEGSSNEILRVIKFVGADLTEEHKKSLLFIADKCPIHKLLSAGAKITTKLASS